MEAEPMAPKRVIAIHLYRPIQLKQFIPPCVDRLIILLFWELIELCALKNLLQQKIDNPMGGAEHVSWLLSKPDGTIPAN
jgi:hypothetical protein